MRYRKGNRGLYYREDGKLSCHTYNDCKLNPFELYPYTLRNNKHVFSDIIEATQNFICAMITLAMIPFLGFCMWIKYRIKLVRIRKEAKVNPNGWEAKLVKELNEKFPKDYYKELD